MSGPFYEPGRYWGVVVGQQLGKTSTDKPQFVLTFQVIGKVNPADPDGDLVSVEQYERTVFRVITDKTVDWLMQDIEYLCEKGELSPVLPGFSYLDPTTPDFLNFRGVEAEFYCEHNKYEGKLREQWGVSSGGGGLEVAPLDDKGVRELDALFGKQLKQKFGNSSRPTSETKPEVPVGETVPPEEDDIPF